MDNRRYRVMRTRNAPELSFTSSSLTPSRSRPDCGIVTTWRPPPMKNGGLTECALGTPRCSASPPNGDFVPR
jgi:hypothetical protein